MADTSGLPNLDGLVDKLVENLFEPTKLTRLQNALRNAHAEGATVAAGAEYAAHKGLLEAGFDEILEILTKALIAATDLPEGLLDPLARGAIESLLQSNVEGRHGADDAGDRLIAKLAGSSSSVEPSIDGAARYLTLFINESVEAWLRGVAVEIVTEFMPKFAGIGGGIETVQKLQEVIEHALGGDRMVRRVLQPFISATAITPAQWFVNKRYTPALLSESLAVRQYLRGKLSREQLDEELARQGWSPERIEAHISNASKNLSLEDTLQLVRHGHFGRDVALETLRDQGYDQATAELALVAAETKRLDALRDDPLSDVTRAYINRDISESEFRTFLPAIIADDVERAEYESAAAIRRALNTRRLSHSEVIDLVEEKILTRVDYRRWLEREGYEPDAAAALELRLAKRLNAQADLEAERARLAAERAEEKRLKAAAAEARRLEVEAERALHRRGSIADLERAVVRGLIPIARLEEVLRAEYDADTLQILVGLVEDDRLQFQARQQAAADARARGAIRRIDVGAIEQAVLQNILTFEEFGQRLAQLGFEPADAAVLVGTLRERKKDLDDAAAKRAQADARAKVKRIDLGRFETLVRRGLRTLADYAALLRSLDYDEGAQAAMVDLLQLKIDDDAAAAQARADAEARLRPKGVSLETLRRAVLLGRRTEADFERFMVDEGFTSDAQALLLAELRDDVAEAAAAQQRRDEAEARAGARVLSLDRLARAVRLGIIQPATYQARLITEGFSDDDVAIEMDVIMTEIADAADARQRRQQLDADSQARGLSLADVARAVKAGVASIEDYRARASTLGYSADDTQLLVAVLAQELAVLDDARARREEIGAELGDRNLSLSQLEALVKQGLRTVDDYIAGVRALGYGADDAELLATLLMTTIAAKTPEGGGDER